MTEGRRLKTKNNMRRLTTTKRERESEGRKNCVPRPVKQQLVDPLLVTGHGTSCNRMKKKRDEAVMRFCLCITAVVVIVLRM
jgi:hypothetical protein